MAQGWTVACDSCGMAFSAWDDGNPWHREPERVRILSIGDDAPPAEKKQYYYHPNEPPPVLASVAVVGNDVKHLCLDCGRKFYCDVIALQRERGRSRPVCIKCGSDHVYGVPSLAGRPCPKCREGTFGVDPDSFMIS